MNFNDFQKLFGQAFDELEKSYTDADKAMLDNQMQDMPYIYQQVMLREIEKLSERLEPEINEMFKDVPAPKVKDDEPT
jgi:hypothetical protein